MQTHIAQWANAHSTFVLIGACLIGIPLLAAECWWFVHVFRDHLASEKEMREASRERSRELKAVLIRLWASIRRAEEWDIDTTEAKQTFDSILDCKKESEHLDVLFFYATAPSILGMFICAFTAWMSILVFEITLALWAVTLVWLVVGLTWFLLCRKAFKAKYVSQ